MKTVEIKNLQAIIKALKPIAAKNNTTLEARKGILYKNGSLIASNSSVEVRRLFESTLETEEFVISEKLADFILALKAGEELEINYENNQLFTKYGKSKSVFSTFAPETYSLSTVTDEENSFVEIDAEEFSDAIANTMYLVDEQSTNSALKGLTIDCSSGALNVVGLNSHCVAIANVGVLENEFRIMIPKGIASEILKEKFMGKIKFSHDNSTVVVKNDSVTIRGKQIEGKPFDYKQFLNFSGLKTAKVDKAELAEMLNAVNAISTNDDKKPLIFEFRKSGAGVSYKNALSSYETELNINLDKIDGESLRIGFNPRFLINSLATMDSETIEIYLSGSTSPLYILNEKHSIIDVVLPVNINSSK